ncbi:predicted protein [Nematostella vectensis]|uniref:FUN14 domain-containing protein 1 n=1 Tax=Nematostella vectensis TaxID=45351 RepID=A7SUB5_NEMVE|nr:FUN14 domain-containing protein 1B [Nematostella vectensis]EDO32705.1 predicted protein [Nematostella vectensis]|eukprot:XP_001624805.1 predicted protein [Nematostella vectensis]
MSDPESDKEDSQEEPYEIIETPGARQQDLLRDLMSMDLGNRTTIQQIGIGGATGWFAGYMCKKIGKLTISAIGGGILILQIAHKTGYININWKKVEKDYNKVSRHVEREVYKVAQGNSSTEQRIVGTGRQIFDYAKRNMAAASGFAGGFLIGMAF